MNQEDINQLWFDRADEQASYELDESNGPRPLTARELLMIEALKQVFSPRPLKVND